MRHSYSTTSITTLLASSLACQLVLAAPLAHSNSVQIGRRESLVDYQNGTLVTPNQDTSNETVSMDGQSVVVPVAQNDTTVPDDPFAKTPTLNTTLLPTSEYESSNDFIKGTNLNTIYITPESANSTTAFGLVGDPSTTLYLEALDDPKNNPRLPPAWVDPADATNVCEYDYSPVLAGGNTSIASIWGLPGYVWWVPADVRQGGLGDCGLGAATMALASDGIGISSQVRYLVDSIQYAQADASGSVTMAFSFKYPGSEDFVFIDDTIPTVSNGNAKCSRTLGYRPVQDAVVPGPDGSYPPTNTFYLTLLEKAVAKYWDAYSFLKTDVNKVGYLGGEGINPAVVLSTLTGGQRREAFRTMPGLDPALTVALYKCFTDRLPCVIGTPNAKTLEGLGTPDQYGVTHLFGESGWASPNKPDNDVTFTVIDFDNLNSEGRSSLIEIVGEHAYAIDQSRSSWNGLITLLNPWGCNPEYKDKNGYCSSYNGAEIVVSLRTLLSLIVGVYSVESLP